MTAMVQKKLKLLAKLCPQPHINIKITSMGCWIFPCEVGRTQVFTIRQDSRQKYLYNVKRKLKFAKFLPSEILWMA
jgi:hypothetical protein